MGRDVRNVHRAGHSHYLRFPESSVSFISGQHAAKKSAQLEAFRLTQQESSANVPAGKETLIYGIWEPC